MRKFTGDKLVIATHNKGKLKEIADLLAPFNVQVISAGELNLPEPEETGVTFIENATIKALASAQAANLPALADDSGLAVHALNGEPGVYSARWAGESKDFVMAMGKINDMLNDKEDKSAHFACALVLAWPDGHTEEFEGQVQGNISWPPRGEKGFGYDPFFVPVGHDKTFAELDLSVKQSMSHRANAFKLLIEACFGKE